MKQVEQRISLSACLSKLACEWFAEALIKKPCSAMRLACGLVLKICNFDKNKKPSVRNTESELLVLLETKGYAIKTCTSYCYKSTLNLSEMNFSETLLLNDKLSV